MRRDPARVLPIGGPQDVIMNRLIHKPHIVRGKNVMDAFAGSGVLGLMALKLGARHVDFVDVSARAVEFAIANCRRNGFDEESFKTILGSVADFACDRPYDVVLANPPFVMTPPGIEGTLTSRAGPEGNDFVQMLLARLDELLAPDGEAYIYLLQFVKDDAPLIVEWALRHIAQRSMKLTPTQQQTTPVAHYVAAYLQRFPKDVAAVRSWESNLLQRYGIGLGIQHYVMHVQPTRPGPSSWSIVDDLAAEYGDGFVYPASSHSDLALGRVAENFILPGDGD
jgi:predicted nicotinamide N-methyase